MKNLILTIIAIIFSFSIFAQTEDTLSLKDLEIPNSPGFILLDQAPTSIERPTSTKAFALSVINSLDDNFEFPKNYAVEFTPFWFFKHPNMTALKYMGYDIDDDKQKIFSGFKTSSISAAFINSRDSLTNQTINNFSIGWRANLISVRNKKDIGDLKKANDKIITYLRDLDTKLAEANIFPISPNGEVNKEYDNQVKEFLEEEEKKKNDDKDVLAEILKRKPVFAIDAAVAFNSFFIDNDFSSNRFGRFGTWVTINYSQTLDKGKKSKDRYLNIYALGRFIKDGTMLTNDEYVKRDFYDFGGKLEFEFKKLSIAYEYIERITDDENTHRSNGILKYKISDQLYLTGAFGKNFGDNDDLISLLGINWGFSTGQEKTKIKKKENGS